MCLTLCGKWYHPSLKHKVTLRDIYRMFAFMFGGNISPFTPDIWSSPCNSGYWSGITTWMLFLSCCLTIPQQLNLFAILLIPVCHKCAFSWSFRTSRYEVPGHGRQWYTFPQIWFRNASIRAPLCNNAVDGYLIVDMM